MRKVFAVSGLLSLLVVGAIWMAQPETDGMAAQTAGPAAITCPTPSAARTDGLAKTLIPRGYLHTAGSQIVDEAGAPVRIASVGWNQEFDHPERDIPRMVALGFNAVRTSWVDATMAHDLERIDRIVAVASQHGLRVILDHHTNEAGTPADGYGAQQLNGLWYDLGPGTDGTNGVGVKGTVTQAKFLSDWVAVAKRYANTPTVIGFDLQNEPLAYGGQCTWGDGGVHDLRAMYQTVGNAILDVNPGVLIIAEGPQNYATNYAGTAAAPYGDLSLAGKYPVVLKIPNKVVYSVHNYPSLQAGFKGADTGPAAVARMNADFGYLVRQHIAPVWIGEMGASMDTPAERAWAATLVDYLNGRLGALGGPTFRGAEQGISTDWWAWGNFGDNFPKGTLLQDGAVRPEQWAVYSQLAQRSVCSEADSMSASQPPATHDRGRLRSEVP